MSQVLQLSKTSVEDEHIDNIEAASYLFSTSKSHDIPVKLDLYLSDHNIVPQPVIEQEAEEPQITNHQPDHYHTCPICYNDYTCDQVIKTSCNHIFCKECIGSYLKTKIDSFQPENIKCPQADCTGILNQQEIETLLDQPTLEKYKNFLLLKAQARNPLTKYCPQPGCARVLKLDSTTKFTTCECGALICNECFQPRHDGKSCADVLKENYEPFMNNKELKMCLICKTGVEKWTGCPKMQCPICDYTWCWNCGNEYSGGHNRRCKRKWDPKPPKMFTEKEKASACKQLWTATALIFEIIFSYMIVLVRVMLIWPFAGCLYLLRVRLSRKRKCLLFIPTLIGCIVTWPIAIILVPVMYIADEYFNFCQKKRWVKGSATSFGIMTRAAKVPQRPREVIKVDSEEEKKEEGQGQTNEDNGLNIVSQEQGIENEDLERGKVYKIEI